MGSKQTFANGATGAYFTDWSRINRKLKLFFETKVGETVW